MPLSQFILRLKTEEEKTRQMVVRARVNPAEALRQARRPKYVKRDANVKALVQEYRMDNRLQFLKAVQHHSSKFAFVPEGVAAEEDEEESDDENLDNL